MQPNTPPDRRLILRSLVASLCLHAVAVGLSLRLTPPRPTTPPIEGIAVELLSPDQFAARSRLPGAEPKEPPARHRAAAETQAAAAPPADTSGAMEARETEPVERPGGMIRASRLYSAGILADPRSRQAREALERLAPNERALQLCNTEAQEQVDVSQPDFQPDHLIAHALSSVAFSGTAIEAEGGVFRSRRRWYEISFRCDLAADLTSVTGFEFRIGNEIPRSTWQRLHLTPDDNGGE